MSRSAVRELIVHLRRIPQDDGDFLCQLEKPLHDGEIEDLVGKESHPLRAGLMMHGLQQRDSGA